VSTSLPMTSTPPPPPSATPDPVAADVDSAAVAERLFDAAVATFEQIGVHLGLRLGLYAALHEQGLATAPELAAAAGTDARYTQEWLEHQAVAGFLQCLDATAAPERRTFAMPAGVAEALFDPTSPAFMGPLPHAVLSVTQVLDDLEHAYRTGSGVAFHRYGEGLSHGLGALNGAVFDRSVAGWLTHLPDVEARLRTGDAPVILDLGCGTGRSTLALARAFPNATVRGVDLDTASIASADAAAAREGLADRVTFVVGDAASIVTGERYDLVTVFEALHDMGDPVGSLRAARAVLADGGAVLIADERTADGFQPDGDPMERFLYGWSIVHCLPATRAETHVTANGTVLRASTLAAWAEAAGFAGATVLDIEDDMWRFYRL
jgi:SAM-dependent methyltransferase